MGYVVSTELRRREGDELPSVLLGQRPHPVLAGPPIESGQRPHLPPARAGLLERPPHRVLELIHRPAGPRPQTDDQPGRRSRAHLGPDAGALPAPLTWAPPPRAR